MQQKVRLSDAIEEYEAHLEARGLAHNTKKNTNQVLNQALATWGNLYLGSIEDHHIDRLFAAHNWSPRTRNLYLGNLRKFFTWARKRRYLPKDADPTALWTSARVPINDDKTRVPVEKFRLLLDSASNPRDRALIALGLYTFARGSEMTSLKIKDLDLQRSTLRIKRHKTKDTDMLPVSSELAAEMARWLDAYRRDQGTLEEDWFLIPAMIPEPFRTGRTYKPYTQLCRPYLPVKQALTKIGITEDGEGAHTLRRSGARALADSLRDQGYDGALMRVASMLGHRSARVTEQYIGWGLERTQRNESIAGKPMFPEHPAYTGGLRLVEEA